MKDTKWSDQYQMPQIKSDIHKYVERKAVEQFVCSSCLHRRHNTSYGATRIAFEIPRRCLEITRNRTHKSWQTEIFQHLTHLCQWLEEIPNKYCHKVSYIKQKLIIKSSNTCVEECFTIRYNNPIIQITGGVTITRWPRWIDDKIKFIYSKQCTKHTHTHDLNTDREFKDIINKSLWSLISKQDISMALKKRIQVFLSHKKNKTNYTWRLSVNITTWYKYP